MLIKAKDLKNYRLDSLSGEIGRVQEFYFDDKHWVVRYLVADTGDWMPGRMVLLSPYALGAVSKEGHNIAVALTKAQIEASPALESAKPVSPVRGALPPLPRLAGLLVGPLPLGQVPGAGARPQALG